MRHNGHEIIFSCYESITANGGRDRGETFHFFANGRGILGSVSDRQDPHFDWRWTTSPEHGGENSIYFKSFMAIRWPRENHFTPFPECNEAYEQYIGQLMFDQATPPPQYYNFEPVFKIFDCAESW